MGLKLLVNFFVLLLLAANIASAQKEPDSAYISITLQTADGGYLIIDDDFDNCLEFKNGQSIALVHGKRKLRIASKYNIDSYITLNLAKGESKPLKVASVTISDFEKHGGKSSYARCFWGTNTFIYSDADSEVWLESQLIPYNKTRFDLYPGTYSVTSKIGSTQKKVTFKTDGEFLIIRNYLRPERDLIYKRSLIPGYAQLTKMEKLKGYGFLTSISAAGLTALFYEYKFFQNNKDYELLQRQYSETDDPNQIFEIITLSEKKLEQMNRYERTRNISFAIFGVLYGLNVLDGIQKPKLGFRKGEIEINPYFDFDRSLVPQATIQIDLKK